MAERHSARRPTPSDYGRRVWRLLHASGYLAPSEHLVSSHVNHLWRVLFSATHRACMHDPRVYANPDEFYPDRFIKDGGIDPGVRDPLQFVFGFGRRWGVTRLALRVGCAVRWLMLLLCPEFVLDDTSQKPRCSSLSRASCTSSISCLHRMSMVIRSRLSLKCQTGC